MAETRSLKALADAVLRRDTRRDDQRDKASHGGENPRDGVRHPVSASQVSQSLRGETVRHPETRQADLRQLYVDLTADLATDEDVQALRWLSDHGHASLVGELLDLDRHAHELVRRDADEADVRAAIGRFVNAIHEMRTAYRRERT